MPNVIITTASIIRGPQSFEGTDSCKGKLKCLRNGSELREVREEELEEEKEEVDDEDEEEEEEEEAEKEEEEEELREDEIRDL